MVSVLGAVAFVGGMAFPILSVGSVSVQQVLVPDHLRGRVNATSSVVLIGSIPFAALLTGQMGELPGIRPVLLIGTLGTLLVPLWLVLSPIRLLRALPLEAGNAAP